MVALRDALANAFAEAGETLPTETTAPAEDTTASAETLEVQHEPSQEGRARDESGRFVAKDQPVVEKAESKPEQPSQPDKPAANRPSSWKKDYWPLWDKLEAGQALSQEESAKFLAYINQRDTEYKTGVSTYRNEAQAAKALQDAIAPFTPTLQQHGIEPTTWITNLGRAHQALALGSPEQKVQMFAKLAQDYNVPLNAFGGNENVQAILAQNQSFREEIEALRAYKETKEAETIEKDIELMKTDKDTYPYFEELQEPMAQLLESGQARDLPSAYNMALATNPNLMAQMIQHRMTATQSQEKTQAVQKAKAKAVSPRSATPSGQGKAEAKDRRSALESAFDSMAVSRV